jgi:hypothetical protein
MSVTTDKHPYHHQQLLPAAFSHGFLLPSAMLQGFDTSACHTYNNRHGIPQTPVQALILPSAVAAHAALASTPNLKP